jgi:hypothetical protein
MPRFNDGGVNIKLEKGDIILMGNPTQYGEILAENLLVEDITKANLQTLISASELVRGKFYRITNAVSSTLSLLVQGLTANTICDYAYNTANGELVAYNITTDLASVPFSSAYVPYTGATTDVNLGANDITANAIIKSGGTSAQFLKADGSVDSTDYYSTNSEVTSQPLTGLSVSGSAIVSTDSILTALGKAQNQINAVVGSVNFQGVWNASTNSPALASGVGTKGYYYIVTVAGSTNLNGITDWKLGDWAIYDGTAWQKVDNTDAVVSVNGYMGIVTLAKADIGLGNVENTALSSWAGSTNITTIKSLTASATELITFGATDTGETHIFGGTGRFNGNTSVHLNQNATTEFLVSNTDNTNSTSIGAIRTVAGTVQSGVLSIATAGAYIGTTSNHRVSLMMNGSEYLGINATDGRIQTNQAADTGEQFIVGGGARVNGQILASQNGVFVYLNPTYDTGYAGVQVATAHGLQFATSNITRLSIEADGQIITNNATDTSEHFIIGGSARVNGTQLVTGAATFSSSVTAASFIKSGGTSSQYLMADGSTSTLTNPITGTGTTGKLAKFTSSGAVGDSIVSESGAVISVAGAINITSSAPYVELIDSTNGIIHYLEGNDTSLVLYSDFANTQAGSVIDFRVDGNTTRMSLSATELITFGATDTGEAHIFGGSARVNGVLGINSTPYAWSGVTASSQLGAYGTMYSSTNEHSFANNAYYNGSDFKYINTNPATSYTQFNGEHIFLTAPSGSGGATISFAQVMTLKGTGNLLLGTTTDDGVNKLQVSGSAKVTSAGYGTIASFLDASNSGIKLVANGSVGYNEIISDGNQPFLITVNSSERLRIAGTGAATFSSSVTATKATFTALPTSASGLSAGDIWSDNGTLKIV